MRVSSAWVLVVAGAVLAAGCGRPGGVLKPAATTPTSPTTTHAVAPVAEDALRALLLTPEQINPIMAATDMAVTRTHTALSDDSATMQPQECLAIDGAAQAPVYADSGYTGVREQALSEGDDFEHFVEQAVVAFPSAQQAAAFFADAARQWPACHEYSHLQSGTTWTAGPIVNADGMLSTVATQDNAGNDVSWACGRALTVANNVVVDVNTCSADPKDSAVVIAGQIAAKVPNG
ncbi:sensor domain-containing protein [Mycolicibacter heraklionensis]|uniref:Sensor domain-containing protein n=1 Tax=Mycolicibacter heraklionensis TaxID=512402 RepID=A0A9X7WDK0_9MYCO|nr:sensor domain-containing protein [Mycolicibacter heraklionensis]QZA06193.1 sensor domain-containing protein [Mycolicibacter heraklionensis]